MTKTRGPLGDCTCGVAAGLRLDHESQCAGFYVQRPAPSKVDVPTLGPLRIAVDREKGLVAWAAMEDLLDLVHTVRSNGLFDTAVLHIVPSGMSVSEFVKEALEHEKKLFEMSKLPPPVETITTFWVARRKNSSPPSYAVFGEETGMGRVIDKTSDILQATRRSSPTACVGGFLAGHAEGFEAVQVTLTTTYAVQEVVDLKPVLEDLRRIEE